MKGSSPRTYLSSSVFPLSCLSFVPLHVPAVDYHQPRSSACHIRPSLSPAIVDCCAIFFTGKKKLNAIMNYDHQLYHHRQFRSFFSSSPPFHSGDKACRLPTIFIRLFVFNVHRHWLSSPTAITHSHQPLPHPPTTFIIYCHHQPLSPSFHLPLASGVSGRRLRWPISPGVFHRCSRTDA